MNKLLITLKRTSVTPQFFSISSNILSVRTKSSSSSSSSSSGASSSDSDNEGKDVKKEAAPKPKNEALEKLNSLLKQMVEEDVITPKTPIQLSRPERKPKSKTEQRKVQTVEQEMVNAVKDVAETVGGDKKQTESELLMKLLNTHSEGHTENSLSDIVKGMKIDRESKSVGEKSRAEQVKEILRRVQRDSPERKQFVPKRTRSPIQKRTAETIVTKIDLFGSPPLGIFTQENLKESIKNETWDRLYKRDLKLAVTQPPTNYFQQMILWTEQGKIWKFPINNEQDIGEEVNVCFSEHVFLDKHLEPWCPQRGPIRHFMELVCVGLSKNPYLTVEAKKGHIEWYRNYFESKKKLLQEVGAIPAANQQNQPENEKTE